MTIGGGTYIKYPDSIEGYVLGAQIGKGAFGQVYQATLKYPSFLGEGSQFAIKIIDKQLVLTSDMVQRVKNEVTIHAALEHPNILRLYHFFEDDRNVYLVMELCEKGELYKLLKKNNGAPFEEEQVRGFVQDIVQGLMYLHAQGIIHRDLKLSNILLSRGMQAKIADFGLAVRQSNPYTEQKTLCGTPNYLPPEILSKQPYGMSADIWSLGCIIYTLLVGKPPFESSDLKETFEKVTHSNFSLPTHLSLAARNLIQNMVVKDPKKRLSLEQIQRHPFFRRNQAQQQNERRVINTNRLKPIRQRIRHGTIEIDSEGNVIFDHAEDKSRVVVKKGGINVEVAFFDIREQRQNFQYPELPAAVAKRYELMRKFVHLIQSKTPRVILYSDVLKAYLMESLDFYLYNCNQEDDVKVEYSCASQLLRIIVQGICEREILEPTMEQIQPDWSNTERMCLMDFCTRYHQCLHVAQGLEQQGSPPSVFPFIIKESSPTNSTTIPADKMAIGRKVNTEAAIDNTTIERRFIYGVGWCTCLGKEHYLMLFDDGSSLQVNGPRNTLFFSSRSEAPTEQYSLEHSSLPQHIRLKLVHFPRFMALWDNNVNNSHQKQNKFKSNLTFGTSLMRD